MKILSVNLSRLKGEAKKPIPEGECIEGHGMKGDAHAEPGLRQISLLAFESIEKQNEIFRSRSDGMELTCGDFAENLTTHGIDLNLLQVGDTLKIGPVVELEVSQKGKTCHSKCSVFYRTGDCIMPRECVFAVVLKGGKIQKGNSIIISRKEEK